MEEKDFDELIARYQSARATQKEKALVDAWLHQRQSKDPFEKLTAREKEQTRFRIFQSIIGKSYSSRARQHAPIVFYRVAAAALLVASLSYSILHLTSSSSADKILIMHSISSTNGTKKLILGDSSIIWLKGNSSLLYPEKFETRERQVKLEGEALFEVTKDPARPFIIECGGLVTRVLGTSFNIRAGETSTEVMVLTGKVSISPRDGGETIVLLPNEKAVYDHLLGRIEMISARDAEMNNNTAGTDYDMRFNATRLEEIITRIERKFDVLVSLSDTGLKACTITADFTDQSLQNTISMIAQTLNLEFQIESGHVILKGEACNLAPTP